MKWKALKSLAILAVLFGTTPACETAAVAQGGVEIWNRRFPDPSTTPGNYEDTPVASMFVNADQSLLVAGTRTIGPTSYFQIVKYNADGSGALLGSVRWPLTSAKGIARKAVAASLTRFPATTSTPRVFVAGLVPNNPTPLSTVQVHVVAFNAVTLSSTPDWAIALNTGIPVGETLPVSVFADGNERVAVTYGARVLSGSTKITTVVLSQTNGAILWGPTTFNLAVHENDLPVGVAFDTHSDNNNRLYVAGTYPSLVSGQGLAYIALGYDLSDPTHNWVTPIGLADHDLVATAMTTNGKNQSVFITGVSRLLTSFVPTGDYVTVRLDAESGAEGWRASYFGPLPFDGVDVPNAIAAQNVAFTEEEDGLSNYVYVTGYSANAAGNDDMVTIRYHDLATSYTQDWVGRFDRGVNGDDIGIALSTHHLPPTEVFVTGASKNSSGNWDYVSFRYDDVVPATGFKDPSWNPVVFSGLTTGDDLPAAITHVLGIGLPPNFLPTTVFVTGKSLGIGTGNDMYTIRADGP